MPQAANAGSDTPPVHSFAQDRSSAFASRLLELRKWERENIPLIGPQIALDIVLFSLISSNADGTACAKMVHLAVGYSKDRVREVMQRLRQEGWITYTADKNDGRVRLISVTDKGRRLLTEYMQRMAACTQTTET